jgi:RHS repeat-associated protein
MRSTLHVALAVLLLCLGNAAGAANVWSDNAAPQGQWLTARDACFKGEAQRVLQAQRAAYPSQQVEIFDVQVSPIDPSAEYFCRVVTQRRQIIWITEVFDSSVFGGTAVDACHVPGLSDPDTGLCGARKCNGACPAAGCNQSNPINHFTGSKYQRETDYVGVGQHPLRFERHYNSRDLANVALGRTWRHTYSASLAIDADQASGIVIAQRPDGRVFTFTLAGGVATTDADVSERLQAVPQSGGAVPRWTLTNVDDSREEYDGNGRLERIVDRAGQRITIAYLANGRIDHVRDHFNRRLSFSYDAGGRLSGFTDPASHLTQYGYDAQGRLATVTRPDGRVRTYLYNEAAQTGGANLPQALTGLIDETGQRYATWTFDAQGRATASRLGSGSNTQRVTLAYNADGSTTVTDALGSARIYRPAVSFGVARLLSLSQPCAACGGANAQSQTFDANGNVATRTDFNGNRTNYTYDLARNLETLRVEALTSAGATTPRTRTLSTEWHPTWRLPRRIAEPKRITSYFYHGDTDGAATVSCGATGALCRVRMQATTDLNGSLGFGATTTGTPREWNFTYNSLGQRLTENGPRTDVTDLTTWTWNATTGNPTQVANALNHITQFTSFDANGRPLTVIDPNGVTTTNTHDYRGLLRTRTVSGQTTAFDYTDAGQLRRVTLGDGSYAEYTYDAARRLVQIADNLAHRRLYTLDAAGNITREETVNADGSTARLKTRVFDALGRLAQELGAQSQTTAFGYDGQGNLTTLQDPRHTAGQPIVTTQAYDELNRLRQITDPNPPAGLTQFTYDGRDQLTQVVAPNNATTGYTVDGLGNVTQEISPDRGTVNYTFDAAGNVATRTDARGITATYAYDALNRLTAITYPTSGENVAFTYDSASGNPTCTNGIGRLCQVTDAGGTSRYVYDARGNVVQTVRIELGVTYTTTFTYTLADRLATITAPTGKSFTVARDTVGRVASVTGTVAGQAVALVSNTQYSAEGQVREQTLGNGISQSTAFDADARATGATESGGAEQDIPLPPWALVLLAGGLLLVVAYHGRRQPQRAIVWVVLAVANTTWTFVPLTAYAFDTNRQYDAASNLVSRTNAGGTTAFTYDKLSRLASEAGPARTQSFTYDANGNRLSDGAGSYTVTPNSNRYATIRGAGATYDAAGNLTALATGTPPTTKTFTYNQAGRLSEVRQGATLLASYTYNAFGQRTRKALTAAGAQALGLPAAPLTIVFHYDLAGNLLAETTSTGTPIRTYVWREAATGPLAAHLLDVPIAQIEHANNVNLGGSNHSPVEFVLYFTVDELATPREAKDQAGQAVWRWASDAFGATLPAEDVDGNGQRTVVNLRFPGQYFDREAGLHYNWQRTYDAGSGRYLESDPIGLEGGVNTYAYALGRPTSLADADGLSPAVAGLCLIPGVGWVS